MPILARRAAQKSSDNYRVDIAQWPDTGNPKEGPPGGFSYASAGSWTGGPVYSDAFGSRRAPTPYGLIERYGRLIYAMVARNKDAVSRLPLRLYVDGSRAQGGKPRSACDPIKVGRSGSEWLSRAGMVAPAAVDHVYEIRSHKMLDVLDRPDPDGYFDRKSLIGLMVASQDVLGSAHLVPDGNGWDWEKGTVGSNAPEFLWVMYTQYVIPMRFPGDPRIKYWTYFKDRIPFGSALWFRQTVSLRDPYGAAFSPTYAGDMYQDQEGKFIAYYDQIIGGPRPNLVASPKDAMFPPNEDMRKRHEQDLNRRQAGPNSGNAIVTNGAYDYTAINYPPTDNAGRELSEYDRNCLAAIFGQPPTFYVTDTNLANLQAADEQHARFGVEPRCWSIAGRLTRFVQQFDKRLFFAFDEAIQEDSESKEKVITMRLTTGRTTINQENEEDRWPAVPWGDEPWLPSTLTQPSMMQAQHEQAMKQGEAGIKQTEAGIENDKKTTDFQTSEEPDEERSLVSRAKWLIGQIEGRKAG